MDLSESIQLLLLAGVLLFLLLSAWWNLHFPCSSEVPDAEAEMKAVELQRDVLTEAERRQLADLGYLEIASPEVAERKYRVPSRPGWVEVYDSGRLAMRLCVEPVRPLPAGDLVVMHKLLIEGNEEAYLRTANVVRAPALADARRRRSLL